MRAQKDGVRRSRAVVIRNTTEQLRDTTIPSFLQWFPDGVAGTHEKTKKNFLLKFDDVEVEILFRGLDDADDVKRLLSLEVSFALLDEVREINTDIFDTVQGRVGRYPSVALGGCYTDDGKPNHHVFGATNPPDMDSAWEKYLSNPPENAKIFFQPGALSAEADWTEFLIDGYYENLVQGKTDDWIDVYVNNKFGKSLSGQPVFRSFNRDIHVYKNVLKPVRNSSTLIVGQDFGLTPACTIGQMDPMGRMLILDELVSEGMGILRFAREKLKPLLASKYGGIPVIVVADPAGTHRAETDERSAYDILRQEGFRVVAAKTNAIVGRINAVDAWLTRMVDGKPACLISPNCTNLIMALRGGYRYKLKKSGDAEDSPDKNQHSHIADSFQYLCLHTGVSLPGVNMSRSAVPIQKSNYVWT